MAECEILHLTDLHLLATRAARLHGWPVADCFERALADALAYAPQAAALVLGGDLVDDESRSGYRWLNERLAAVGRPVLAIAGNHDDPAVMQATLSAAWVHGSLHVGGWRLLGVCSHRPGADHGSLGNQERERLAGELAADSRPTLVCIHHPPFTVGSPWIDAMRLTDGNALWAILRRHRHVRGLLCGHVHQAHHVWVDGITAWTTPATMRQFRPASAGFAEDRRLGPGYRWLRLGADGRITTMLRRLRRPATPTDP